MTTDEMNKALNDLAIEQGKMSVRIDNVYDKLNDQQKLLDGIQDLALGMRDMVAEQKNTTNQLKQNSEQVRQLRLDVDEIQRKPAKKWDSVQMTIITVVVTGIITFALTKIFA